MLIVGIGGTLRQGSGSEVALRIALDEAARCGAATRCFSGPDLNMPFYDPSTPARTSAAQQLVETLRQADGIILCSPGYHGLVSGLIKNALDYVEDMVMDRRAYFDGLPIGCIGLGFGHQGAHAAMSALRSVAHALRGWPTPYGCTVQVERGLFGNGVCSDAGIESRLRIVGRQVAEFANARPLARTG